MPFDNAVETRNAVRARTLLDETVDDDDATVGGLHLLRPFLEANDLDALEWLAAQEVVRVDDPRWLESDVGAKLLTAAAVANADALRWFLRVAGRRFIGELIPWQMHAIRCEASDDALRLLYGHGHGF